MDTTWTTLAVIAGIFLLIFFTGKNAVWGGFTIGVVFGTIAAGVYAIFGSGFHWMIIVKWAIVLTLISVVSEIGGRITNKKKRSELP